jgi:hypothetical protein
MRQVPEDELRFAIYRALQQVPRGVWNDLQLTHPNYRYPALDGVADLIVQRMADWEILVPEPATPPQGRGGGGLRHEPQR